MINVTFYNDAVHPDVPQYQEKVFNALGFNICQIKSRDWKGHSGEINLFLEYLDHHSPDEEEVIIWDVDCIPLNRLAVLSAVTILHDSPRLHGIRQHASHIPDSIDYVGPSFMAFTMGTWRALGKPKFDPTERSDCGGEITHLAYDKNVPVSFLEVTDVEEPLWPLSDGTMFGKGTTYGRKEDVIFAEEFKKLVYHAFLSRKGNHERFIEKCKEVLQAHGKN